MLTLRLIYLIAITPTMVALVASQESKSLCPKIEVIGPSTITQPGEEMTFVAKTTDLAPNLRFEWTVTNVAKFLSGQGTSKIVVIGDNANGNVKATVRIIGLPNECDNFASESAGIAPILPLHSIDEWGKLKPNDKRGRLDSFFTELTNNPEQRGVFLFYGVPKEKRTIDNSEIKFILSHAKFRDFDTSRFIFMFGPEYRDLLWTKIYRIRPDYKFPITDVEVIDGKALKKPT